jgi:hypothetical protein
MLTEVAGPYATSPVCDYATGNFATYMAMGAEQHSGGRIPFRRSLAHG